MDKAEVDELERRVKAEFEEKMKAIRLVKEMLSKNGSESVVASAPRTLQSSSDDGSEEDESLVGNVERVFLSDLKRSWTVPKVEKRLIELGVKLEAKNPKPSIAGAIKRLVKRGTVRRIKRGSGRIPHVYRAGGPKEEAGN